jgi:hypothetical protein
VEEALVLVDEDVDVDVLILVDVIVALRADVVVITVDVTELLTLVDVVKGRVVLVDEMVMFRFAYTFNLLGPPQYANLSPPQSILHSEDGADFAVLAIEVPQ